MMKPLLWRETRINSFLIVLQERVLAQQRLLLEHRLMLAQLKLPELAQLELLEQRLLLEQRPFTIISVVRSIHGSLTGLRGVLRGR